MVTVVKVLYTGNVNNELKKSIEKNLDFCLPALDSNELQKNVSVVWYTWSGINTNLFSVIRLICDKREHR